MIEPVAVARIRQQFPSLTSDGSTAELLATRAAQLATAGWKAELAMAGHVYNITVGGIAAGGDVALVTGGGDGTTIDNDQPEMIVGTPTGYFHIPLLFTATIQADHDADADEGNIILIADQTQQVATSGVTGTKATINPVLDGGTSAVSVGWHTVTVDVTDPVVSQVLAYSTNQAAQVDASSTAISSLRLDYCPDYPVLLKGPCSVAAYWGGSAAVTGACSYFFAEVPISRFE